MDYTHRYKEKGTRGKGRIKVLLITEFFFQIVLLFIECLLCVIHNAGHQGYKGKQDLILALLKSVVHDDAFHTLLQL
jgi:hypothetical protein